MPKKGSKSRQSALEKARALFNTQISSDSEDSFTSTDSEEYSHVPTKNQLPFFESLSLNDQEMDNLAAQLAQISQQLTTISQKQNEQEHHINELRGQNLAQNVPAAPELESDLFGVDLALLSKIPDPIKGIPTYNGNRPQLKFWLDNAEKTLNTFKPLVPAGLFNIYLQAVINKLEGKAKDLICLADNINSFTDIKETLLVALGDRQELSTYKTQLWETKQTDSMSIHKYYQITKLILQNIKTLAKQHTDYARNWECISKYIEDDALAAFIAGLNAHYFNHVQAAKPKDLEDAYAFLCKLNPQKQITNNHKKTSNKPNYQNSPNTNHNNIKYTANKQERNSSEPMEIDPSIRSRLTLNRKQINNHETRLENNTSEEQDENGNESEEEDEMDLNFQLAGLNIKPT